MDLLDVVKGPWPWYVAGPLIGLSVPLLLWLGNKPFGISSSLRHICAAGFPSGIPYFSYNWKKEIWNLFFVSGVLLGGWIAAVFLSDPDQLKLAAPTREALSALGIRDFSGLLPGDLFSLEYVFSLKGLIFFIFGGFLVGFGTRYAGGCTSGHSIFGLSNLQWPSLVATLSFMAGGFLCTHLILPALLRWVM